MPADSSVSAGLNGNRRQAAQQELERCRADIAGGNLREASSHVAWALALAPDQPQVYAVLDEFAAAAGSNNAAREYFKGHDGNVSGQNAAAIISLIAAEGDYAIALRLLGSLTAIEPTLPWAGAPWFGPHLAQAVSARVVTTAVVTIFDKVGYPDDPEARAALSPWLGLMRGAAARPEAGADVLRALSGAARRLDAVSDAVTWCEKAVALDRKAGANASSSLIMLGFAQRDAGDPTRATEAWQAALKLAPTNVALLLDLADLAFAQEDYAGALRWAERASALEPDSAKARGAVLSAKVRADGISSKDGVLLDADSMAELFRLAVTNPQNTYMRTLVTRSSTGLPWLNLVPPPTEAIAASARYEAQQGNNVVRLKDLHVMTLEAPSAIHGIRMRHPEARIKIGDVPDPDLRETRQTKYGPALWRYQGTDAVPAVPQPSADAVKLLHEVARGVWGDPLAAYEHAAPLGALSEDDLLGLLAHVPPPSEVGKALDKVGGLYWNRMVQAWVCIGILHHRVDEPWQASARRGLLLRLLHGPEDWTVDSAAFALCLAAWIQPQHKAAIAEEIAARYRFAAEAVGRRFTSLHAPLAAIVLACPGMDPQVVAQVKADLGISRREQAEVTRAQGRLRRVLGARGVRVAGGNDD